MSSDCPSNGRRQARHRDRRRARKTRAPDSDLPKLGGGLPAPIVDDAWPKDAHKQPVLLVVNLDGSACVAIDPEREKELHVVEEVPLDVQQQQAELEELRQRGLLRVGCLDLRPRTLVCAILVLCMAGVLVGLLFAFIGVSNTDCFPPACYPTRTRRTPAPGRRALHGPLDGPATVPSPVEGTRDATAPRSARVAMLGAP